MGLFESGVEVSGNNLYDYQDYTRQHGYNVVAGTDEAGRGPWAGPVVAAAVILPVGSKVSYLNDSKQLTERRRNIVYAEIMEKALEVSWSIVEPEVIDRINILQASRLAMMEAIHKLQQPVDLIFSDAMNLPELKIPCIPLVRGDSRVACIAAASVIAKVTRDQLMLVQHQNYPVYGFDRNKGYGTAQHFVALQQHGSCPIHRKSFSPIKNWEKRYDEN